MRPLLCVILMQDNIEGWLDAGSEMAKAAVGACSALCSSVAATDHRCRSPGQGLHVHAFPSLVAAAAAALLLQHRLRPVHVSNLLR